MKERERNKCFKEALNILSCVENVSQHEHLISQKYSTSTDSLRFWSIYLYQFHELINGLLFTRELLLQAGCHLSLPGVDVVLPGSESQTGESEGPRARFVKPHNLSYLRRSGGPRSSVSKCSSSCANCSCPSVIWSRATFSRLFS